MHLFTFFGPRKGAASLQQNQCCNCTEYGVAQEQKLITHEWRKGCSRGIFFPGSAQKRRTLNPIKVGSSDEIVSQRSSSPFIHIPSANHLRQTMALAKDKFFIAKRITLPTPFEKLKKSTIRRVLHDKAHPKGCDISIFLRQLFVPTGRRNLADVIVDLSYDARSSINWCAAKAETLLARL